MASICGADSMLENGIIAVPPRPSAMTFANALRSADFQYAALAKDVGRGVNMALAGPSPAPDAPWQNAHSEA